jgi:hypothetical protein
MKIAFHTPFDEQLEFFRQKLNLPTARWDDILKAAHDRAFIVAGAAQADLLADLKRAVDKTLSQGFGLAEFERDFKQIVFNHGWSGWTGQGTKAGEAWRTKVIYQTNLMTSYAAGRYAQLTDPEFVKIAPYWRYVHDDSVHHPRPEHKAWGDAGLTLRWDHPFWATGFPPNGWGCMCRVTPVQKPATGDSTTAPEGWDQRDAEGNLPGVDKGFDYQPGASTQTPMQDFIDQKLINLEAPIGAALWESLAPVLKQETETRYLQWLSLLASDATAKSQIPLVGAISLMDLTWLDDHGKTLPKTAEIGISSGVISGPKAIRHANNGDAIEWQIWENLPTMIADPLAVLFDNDKGTLLYVLPEASARRPQLVIEFDYLRKAKSGMNMIISGYRPSDTDLQARIDNGLLTLMRGDLQ